MKGLILKDLLWAAKQQSLLLAGAALAVIYIVMGMDELALSLLPMFVCVVFSKIILFDLQPQNSRFLFTLPFSRRDYIVEKYGITLIVPVLLMIVVTAVEGLLHPELVEMLAVQGIVTVFVLLLFNAIVIPGLLYFKEKGTLWMMLLTMALFIVYAVFGQEIAASPMMSWIVEHGKLSLLLAGCGSVILWILSIYLSMHLIAKEEL